MLDLKNLKNWLCFHEEGSKSLSDLKDMRNTFWWVTLLFICKKTPQSTLNKCQRETPFGKYRSPHQWFHLKTTLHTCTAACFGALWEARSFFIRGLVKRLGWTGTKEGSSRPDIKERLHSSCSGIGEISEEFVSRLSSGTWNMRFNKQSS